MDKRVSAFLYKAGASTLGIGYFPIASGTVGSAAAIAAIWFLHHSVPTFFAPEAASVYWLVIVGAVALCIHTCSRAREMYGTEDPSQIVLDEFVGQWIAFFMVPINLITGNRGFLKLIVQKMPGTGADGAVYHSNAGLC